MFPLKDKNLLLIEMMSDLEAKTGINDFSPGSIARSLLEVYNEKLWGAYEDFDLFISNTYLSSAEGIYVDMIGVLFNCKRAGGESDENYRYRIANQVFTAAKSNETAIRLRCLAVNGVKDVIINRFTRGSGSFTVHVLTDEIIPPELVLSEVRSVVEANKAEGVNAVVTGPRPVSLDIVFSVVLSKMVQDDGRSLASQAKAEIQDYIDKIPMGATVSVQKIVSMVALNESVSKAFLTAFKVDSEDIIIRDEYKLEWDERPYIKDLKINII